MPIYEYHCADCDRSVEVLVRNGHLDDIECPDCYGSRLERKLSVFAARNGSSNGAAAAAQTIASNGGDRMSGGCCGGGCGCH